VADDWSFLTTHAQVLVSIAHDPDIRLRELATTLGITERTAHGVVTDLANEGYVIKEKNGSRNRYKVRRHLPLRAAVSREHTIGDLLRMFTDPQAGPPDRQSTR